MNVYVYAAALCCEHCGSAIRRDLDKAGQAPANPMHESTYDSDDYPKGPYADGGGEADCPQHCDSCGAFLENPLTPDGVDYVREALAEPRARNNEVADQWRAFYSAEIGEQVAA